MPANLDGRSFANVLRGQASKHRDKIYATHSGDGNKNIYPIRALRTEQFKYILNVIPTKSHTTHIDRGGGSGDGWRYFDEWVAKAKSDSFAANRVRAYHERPAEELYDLAKDPDELTNLAANPRYSEQLSQMRKDLVAWMDAQGDKRTVFDTPRELDEPYPKRDSP